MVFADTDAINAVLTDGPLATRCELVRVLRPDPLGARGLAREQGSRRMLAIRAFEVDDGRWAAMEPRLAALAEARHKKLSELVTYGRHGSLGYLAHEHVEGRRLTDLLAERGALTLPEAVPIVSQILMGVGDAHLRRLVVGGVRPHDIALYDERGRSMLVKVRNFGLWPLLGPTSPSGVEDDPTDVLAPEADVLAAPTSDVFSLGALLLRLLSGPLPAFTDRAARAATLRARLEILHGNEPGLPADLVSLLKRTFDPDPDVRPADANRLVEDLIEAVPMSAFRLPKVGEDPTREPSKPSAPRPVVVTPPREASPTPTPAAFVPAPSSGKRGWMLGLVAIALAAGVAMFVMQGGDEPTPLVAPRTEPTPALAVGAPGTSSRPTRATPEPLPPEPPPPQDATTPPVEPTTIVVADEMPTQAEEASSTGASEPEASEPEAAEVEAAQPTPSKRSRSRTRPRSASRPSASESPPEPSTAATPTTDPKQSSALLDRTKPDPPALQSSSSPLLPRGSN